MLVDTRDFEPQGIEMGPETGFALYSFALYMVSEALAQARAHDASPL